MGLEIKVQLVKESNVQWVKRIKFNMSRGNI